MNHAGIVSKAARKGQMTEAKEELRLAARGIEWYTNQFHEIDASCFADAREHLARAEALWKAATSKSAGES